jgi:type I restriction enzyme, S subunit
MKKEWETKTIGDVCEFQRGLTYAKGDEVDVSDNVVLRATNIDLATNLLIFDELKYINEKVVIPESKKIKKGSLMICMASGSKSHLGKVAFIDDDYGYAFGGFMGMLTPLAGLLPKYLFHLMTSEDYKDFIGALSDGANINNLTFDKLKVFPVPLPPLPEQRRIVGILDEAFAGLATAKANAGKNLQNARALFESHLNDVFIKKGEGWVETRLDKISTNLDSRRVPITKNVRSSGEYPYYGASGIVDYVAEYIFDGNNLLVSEDGANLLARATPIAFSVSGKYWVNNHAHILHFDNMATQRFAEFYLESIPLDEYITGAAQPKLNQKALNSIPIPIPKSVDEQAEIVESIEGVQEETRRLAALYERKQAALGELKKSLLHQAFAGEL